MLDFPTLALKKPREFGFGLITNNFQFRQSAYSVGSGEESILLLGFRHIYLDGERTSLNWKENASAARSLPHASKSIRKELPTDCILN